MTRIHFQELIHSKTGGVFPYTTDELAFYMLDYIKNKYNSKYSQPSLSFEFDTKYAVPNTTKGNTI